MTRDAPWVEWGGDGPDLTFAHANGFPIATYRPLLERLERGVRVTGWQARPLRPGTRPEEISTWGPLARDLAEEVAEKFSVPVIGVGHSLGAVLTLLAASEHPDLFRGLVLLDPVIFTGVRSRLVRLMKRTGQTHRIPVLAGALRRRDHWPDRETARRAWTKLLAYDGWSTASFGAYLDAGLTEEPDRGGLTLTYPKAWEARIFETIPDDVWDAVGRLRLPILLLRGEDSDTLSRAAARRFVRLAPQAEHQEVPETGHLFPMQRPKWVAATILEWVANLG